MAGIHSTAQFGRALAGLGLALLLLVLLSVLTLGSGVAPSFHQTIPLGARSFLAFDYGLRPSCLSTPNPPQHDCFEPDQAEREFSVSYVSPHGARSLIMYKFPTSRQAQHRLFNAIQ